MVDYYKEIYLDDGTFSPLGISGAFPRIDDDDLRCLERRVTNSEIFQTVKQMGALRHQGQTGSKPCFFKSNGRLLVEKFVILFSRFLMSLARLWT